MITQQQAQARRTAYFQAYRMAVKQMAEQPSPANLAKLIQDGLRYCNAKPIEERGTIHLEQIGPLWVVFQMSEQGRFEATVHRAQQADDPSH